MADRMTPQERAEKALAEWSEDYDRGSLEHVFTTALQAQREEDAKAWVQCPTHGCMVPQGPQCALCDLAMWHGSEERIARLRADLAAETKRRESMELRTNELLGVVARLTADLAAARMLAAGKAQEVSDADKEIQRCREIAERDGADYLAVVAERDAALRDASRLRAVLKKATEDMRILIGNSQGVAGLHLNGDLAPWDELESTHQFCRWLEWLPAAEAALAGGDHD